MHLTYEQEQEIYQAERQEQEDKELYMYQKEGITPEIVQALRKAHMQHLYSNPSYIAEQKYIRAYRMEHDVVYAFKYYVSGIIRKGFKKFDNEYQRYEAEQILGCTFLEFRKHLESKFEPWMNWQNKGKYNGTLNYGWDVDHITPLITAKTKEDIIRLNHYTNLQPLCSRTNRNIKVGKTDWQKN